jgi:adenylate cyclase
MADVFISYARASAPQAHRVAEGLRSLGYEVWRDDELPVHRAYAEEIAERLEAAKAVLVLWCSDAVQSQWVQSEADRARILRKLVQSRLDDATLPMPFDRIECADLRGWSGAHEASAWRKIASSIAHLAGPRDERIDAIAGPDLPSIPAIAVLPFGNLSQDPEQAYFAEGVVEEIVSSLARFKSIFVTAAGPGQVVDGRVLSPREAARAAGVRYLLEGSVRKAANRVRIAVHLIDAADGRQLWADRLDADLEDVFALEDRVAERVAGVIETTVIDADAVKASKRPTTNMGSYDLYLRSLPLFRAFRKEEMLASTALLERAIDLDPGFALAVSQSAINHRQIIEHGWTDDPEQVRRRGLEMAERAMRLADGDSRVMAQVAVALPGLDGRLDRALTLIERAIAANPSSSFVWVISGVLQIRNGRPDLAAEHLDTAMRLDPISTMNGLARMYLAQARFQQDRLDDAVALFETTTFRLPVSHVVLAAIYGHRGRAAEARAELATFESLSAGTIEAFGETWFPRPDDRTRFMDGLALARGGR